MSDRSIPDFVRVAEDIEAGLVANRQARPNPAGGQFKSSINTLPCVWFDRLQAEAVGDADEVLRLLQGLKFLGGRRSLAMGRVRSISIATIGEAAWTARTMPSDADIPMEMTMTAMTGVLRAPYWRRSDQCPTLFPAAL